VRDAGLTNVELRKMDAEHLEFTDHSFDIVTCAFSLFLFLNVEAALCEMYRVYKPGGYVSVSLFDKTPPPFNPGLQILIQQFMEYQWAVRMPQPMAYAPEDVGELCSADSVYAQSKRIARKRHYLCKLRGLVGISANFGATFDNSRNG
jgi:ubiquinone/menaquinone biosynthesis C-methylase UbiE